MVLFLIAMASHGSFALFKSFFMTSSSDYRLVAVVADPIYEVPGDANVGWDELVYIPRFNGVATGRIFSDPWNSYNESFFGLGAFSLLPPLLAGAFVSVFGHHYLSLGIWALFNFFLLALIFTRLFMAAPLVFSQSASILMTFVVMSFTWLGSWPLEWFSIDLIVAVFFRGNLVSAETDIEAGLFTHLFYAAFLMCYWHFVAGPRRGRAIAVGAVTGLLLYVYFYHFVFAYGMLVAFLAVSVFSRNWQRMRFAGMALVVGIVVALPFLWQSFVVGSEIASVLYQERLDYSAGRNPVRDYHWFANLALPLVIALLYLRFRPAGEVKTAMLQTWIVLVLAYAMVLNIRVILGYMQAEDHFWRHSLGMPATVWCVAAIGDLIRTRLGALGLGKQLVFAMALALPALVLARTAAKAVYHLGPSSSDLRLSSGQKALLDKVECLKEVVGPGEGFLSDEPALNYHVMANLKGVPFMAMGLSPVSVETLTTRYLLSSYLLGKDDVKYPLAHRGKGYVHAVDPHLYLYINLFQGSSANSEAELRVRNLYRDWKSENVDWEAWSNALASVKAAYVPRDRSELATARLKRVYEVERSVSCLMGDALRLTPIMGDSQKVD